MCVRSQNDEKQTTQSSRGENIDAAAANSLSASYSPSNSQQGALEGGMRGVTKVNIQA